MRTVNSKLDSWILNISKIIITIINFCFFAVLFLWSMMLSTILFVMFLNSTTFDHLNHGASQALWLTIAIENLLLFGYLMLGMFLSKSVWTWLPRKLWGNDNEFFK